MSIPIKDTTQPDPATRNTPDPQQCGERQDGQRYGRDTDAVFNVLDALEPPPGRQRLLRTGMMIVAGAFFLLAIALLLSQYTEDLRQQSTRAGPQVTAMNARDAAFDRAMPEDGPGAQPDVPAKTKGEMQASPGSRDAAAMRLDAPPVAIDLRPPAVAVEEAIGQPLIGTATASADAAATEAMLNGIPSIARKPVQQMASPASRKTGSNPAGAKNISRLQHRHAEASRPEQRANRMPASGKSAAPEKYRRSDADVDLIAALLSRAPQKPGRVEGSDKAARAVASTGTPPLQSRQPPHLQAALGGSTANADVVIRTQTDTTESLVQRCGTLGLIEGHLCRVRICSGLWGKDAACPAGSTAPVH